MRFVPFLPALLSLLSSVSGQTSSGLTFDAGDEVNFLWAFDGMTTGRYDFYLCAGDESTGQYVGDQSWGALRLLSWKNLD